MKTLEPVTVGEYTVNVTVEESGTHQLLFRAACGEISHELKLNPQLEHSHSDEQWERDMQEAALRVATECAGKCRAADLRRKFLG